MKLKSGHTATRLTGQDLASVTRGFTGYEWGIVRLQPGGWILPGSYLQFADGIYDFEYREDDVVVMTYPKCGTTWMQELAWTMRHNPNLDNPKAHIPILDRVPYLDGDMFFSAESDTSYSEVFEEVCPKADLTKGVYLLLGRDTLGARTFKIHLPFSLLNPRILEHAKVVYVVRNPRDVALSYFHHTRLFSDQGFNGSLQGFVEHFVQDHTLYSPYWNHVKEAWEKRDHPNVHFVFYEDLKKDNMAELRKLDAFLGTKHSEEQLENIAKYTSFNEMKKRDNLIKGNLEDYDFVNREVLKTKGGFFRKGTTGNWEEDLTPEMKRMFDLWIKEKFNFGFEFK